MSDLVQTDLGMLSGHPDAECERDFFVRVGQDIAGLCIRSDIHPSTYADLKRLYQIALRYRRMDAEAANHVESLICLRSHRFTGDHPYVGWKGLGLALKQDYDELEELRASDWQPIEMAPKDGTHILAALDWLPYPKVLFWAVYASEWRCPATEFPPKDMKFEPKRWMPVPKESPTSSEEAALVADTASELVRQQPDTNLVQTPSSQAETSSGHLDFKKKSWDMIFHWRDTYGSSIVDHPVRAAIDHLAPAITSALSEAVNAEREACAAMVNAESDRILGKQDGKCDGVDQNLRLMACFLPSLAEQIRNRGIQEPRTAPEAPKATGVADASE